MKTELVQGFSSRKGTKKSEYGSQGNFCLFKMSLELLYTDGNDSVERKKLMLLGMPLTSAL